MGSKVGSDRIYGNSRKWKLDQKCPPAGLVSTSNTKPNRNPNPNPNPNRNPNADPNTQMGDPESIMLSTMTEESDRDNPNPQP